MIITEHTPNPDSLKFLSEKTISKVGTEEFQKKDLSTIKNVFIKDLLKFKGVELILLAEKFLSVKKTSDVSWDELKPMVISHMNDYFQKNEDPILNTHSKEQVSENSNDETVKQIKEILDSK